MNIKHIALSFSSIFISLNVIAADYYVDSVNGNDETQAASVSESSPWQSLGKLELHLQEDDKVFLKRGSLWYESLTIDVDGVTVDAYGTGANPVISGGALFSQSQDWQLDVNGEYILHIGPGTEFTSEDAVVVYGQPGDIGSYKELTKNRGGTLADGEYTLKNNEVISGWRTLRYKPKPFPGEDPSTLDFEVSKRLFAINVTGDNVTVKNITGMVAHQGHKDHDPQLYSAVIVSSGEYTTFENLEARFGRAFGIALENQHGAIRNSLAEYNRSTGLYLVAEESESGVIIGAHNSEISGSTSRHNGNLWHEGDRGGIGIQANNAEIFNNIVHDNGNLLEGGGDAAISIYRCNNATIDRNFIVNSARNGIQTSQDIETYGHQISRNIIHNWNLLGIDDTVNTSAIFIPDNTSTSLEDGPSLDIDILHNTIVSDNDLGRVIGITVAATHTSHVINEVRLKNNIIYIKANDHQDSKGLRFARGHQFHNSEIDHNLVSAPNIQYPYYFSDNLYEDAAAFRAHQSHRAYGIGGVNDVPQFISPTLITATDFMPAANATGLIDGGDTLESTFDTDYLDNPRIAAPDMGAFEYGHFQTATIHSDGQYDGQVDELSIYIAERVKIGDTGAPYYSQLKFITSFDLSAFSDKVIASAKLRLHKYSETNTTAGFGDAYVDLSIGGFSGDPLLEIIDHNDVGTALDISTIDTASNISLSDLNSTARALINNATSEELQAIQFRVQFKVQTNYDNQWDYINYYTGQNPVLDNKPQLIIEYY